ncbi:XRE family transcriptional regulator [Sphingorhabdus lutea]|uniref:XRE family transcriptional regulator n=1 Tax=Sphingorhabdus lutea TaxID=1913578 RepID=A0A1L3JBH4_9SPHN|nr:helix-turn-helix transcriptional regulator [Sphingorhabdus lutea]APG62480.1 XRE family transcriptional regulator [Sphingorhabdus lutea]
MAQDKVFAGHVVRRLRRDNGMTQVQMAELLEISASYLNLVERNQRPLTASFILKLVEKLHFDPRSLSGPEPGGGVEAVRRRLGDRLFQDIGVDRAQIVEWLASAPDTAEAFARLYDMKAMGDAGTAAENIGANNITILVRQEIERWNNHFADLDNMAEKLADDLRLQSGDVNGAMVTRLREKHQLGVRILPADILINASWKLDYHARQIQISELLDHSSRNFALAASLARLEAVDEIEALVRGAAFDNKVQEQLYRRHLRSYFAAAILMPYGRFVRACESSAYDFTILQRRFSVGFEQLAHRLTTLNRVGQRGLPFFMLRIDKAGQVSKRFSGASNSPLVAGTARCPLWNVHDAFYSPGSFCTQYVELEDQSRWFTISRTVSRLSPHAPSMQNVGRAESIGDVNARGISASQFAISLGVEASHAGNICYFDQAKMHVHAVGLGCAQCTRANCAQRAAPPQNRALIFRENERAFTPFSFIEE